MEIPFKRIVWNEHEAALLVEVYEKVQNGLISRPIAISQLSKRLRAPMLKDRVVISEKYRNVTGVDLQLNVIERYLSGGNEGFGSITIPKTFEKIITLKQEQPSSFKKLLNEANLLYPIVHEIRYDAIKHDNDSHVVSEPEVDVTPKMTSLFDWNKFEAALIINLYNQIQNKNLIEADACDLMMTQFSNCSSVMDRDTLPSREDFLSAFSDVKAYEKRLLKEINYELERTLDLFENNELDFRKLLDSAMKLYPLKSIVSFYDHNSSKDEKLEMKNIPIIPVIVNDKPEVWVQGEDKKNSLTNKVEEVTQNSFVRVQIYEEKNVEEKKEIDKPVRKSIVDIANESQFVNSIESLKKNGKFSIDDFFCIKNRIYHIIPANDFYGRSKKPSFYSTLVKENGQKYVIWHVDNYDCDENEVVELLTEYAAYKERNGVKSIDVPKITETSKKDIENKPNVEKLKAGGTAIKNSTYYRRIYSVPAHNSQVIFCGVKMLTLRARSIKEVVDYAFSMGISKIIPIKTFVEIDGKSCHAIPLENFVPSPQDGDYIVKKNPYGIDFAIWYVDAAKDLSNNDVFELVKESICFNSLKPDSYIEPENVAAAVIEKIEKKPVVKDEEKKMQIQPNMKIKEILVENYRNGYRLGSNLDRKRFANFYEQKYGEALSINGDTLDKEISKCGIVCAGNKLYVPEEMLDAPIREELFDYINKQFETATQCIYYNVLFNDFSDKFLAQKIFDDAMLHSYLEFYDTNGDYIFDEQYFSKDADFSLDIDAKVIEFVKEQGCCVCESEVVYSLPFIPEDKVIEAFKDNKNILLTAGRGKRFHISNFQLEIEDKQALIDYLSKEIKEVKFVSFLELLDKLKIIAPRIVDNNIQFTDTGIRCALSVMLNDLFYIRGGIISDIKNPISLQDVFVEFARGRDSFTTEEAQLMADDFGTLINFEALTVHNIRVSEKRYISKDSINFPTQDIDNAIEMYCKDDIISILDISTFAAFPECGYKWNKFLLESYVYDSSKKFCLFHNRFNKSSVSGAIVRKSAKYNSYNDVLAKALSDTTIPLDKKTVVLDYLAETGFISRRQLDGIDQVILRAQQLKK